MKFVFILFLFHYKHQLSLYNIKAIENQGINALYHRISGGAVYVKRQR